MMRFYTTTHRFYCSVDLHARTISPCVLEAAGATVLRLVRLVASSLFRKTGAPPPEDINATAVRAMLAGRGADCRTGARWGEPAAAVECGTSIPTPTSWAEGPDLDVWMSPRHGRRQREGSD